MTQKALVLLVRALLAGFLGRIGDDQGREGGDTWGKGGLGGRGHILQYILLHGPSVCVIVNVLT